MESVKTSKANSREMQQDQSSRQRRKLTFTITFVVIFSLIFCSIITVIAILKHDIEGDSLSANPTKAIQAVCSLTPFGRECSKSLAENLIIYPSKTINPSKIFTLSLHAAIKQLNDLISTTPAEILKAKDSTTSSTLKDCQNLFKDSMKLVKKAKEVMDQFDPDENVFKDDKFMIRILPDWMWNATENIGRCLTEMERREWDTKGGKDDQIRTRKIKTKTIEVSWRTMKNSLMILLRMEEILELFDPRLRSVLANLLLGSVWHDFSLLVFFGSQYLVLLLLIVLVIKS